MITKSKYLPGKRTKADQKEIKECITLIRAPYVKRQKSPATDFRRKFIKTVIRIYKYYL